MKNIRNWRKHVKKLQRKRRRCKAAQERDRKLEEAEAAQLSDPAHQQWLQQQTDLEQLQRLADERAHAEQEEQWLRQDLLLQHKFNLVQQQRAAIEAAQEAERLQQAMALEALEQRKRAQQAEKERRQAEATAEFERMLASIEQYLSDDASNTAPDELKRYVQTRPGQNLCELYTRTNCCRFGVTCSYNHRRPLLSKIILLQHFFAHPALEWKEHVEYASADATLESSEHDLCEEYRIFFNDVLPELKRFGEIQNIRTTRNVQRHLRGHVFVEYIDEKSALKAFINLQGRYYAARRLNVEFSNIVTWRGSVCGLSLTRKCAKGHNCNYLHLFRNPGNKYNTLLEMTKGSSGASERKTPIVAINTTPTLSWNDMSPSRDTHKSRHWRWSESPEIETKRLQDNVEQLQSELQQANNNEHDNKADSKGGKDNSGRKTKHVERKETQEKCDNQREDGKSRRVRKKSPKHSRKSPSSEKKSYRNRSPATKSYTRSAHQSRSSSAHSVENKQGSYCSTEQSDAKHLNNSQNYEAQRKHTKDLSDYKHDREKERKRADGSTSEKPSKHKSRRLS